LFRWKDGFVMAERKSTKAVNARKKALEAAREFAAREERLLALAEDFFKLEESSGVASIDKKIEDYLVKIEQLKVERVEAEKASEVDQAAVIERFKSEGVNNSEIASRLAIATADVRRLAKMSIHNEVQSDNEQGTSPA
jgi:DNA-directed RNA polymerase specialized sigma subunit